MEQWSASGGMGGGNKPHSRLGELLQAAENSAEVLPWCEVERLVATAQPVRQPWFTALSAPARPLRFATSMLALVVCSTIVLAALPAQSDQVGTLVVSKLPSGWQVGSPAYEEVKLDAQRSFSQLSIPQGELYLMIGARSGRDQLAFAMLGADQAQAQAYYAQLCQAYPALAAYSADYEPIDSGRYGSLLNELLVKLGNAGQASAPDDAELKAAVLKTLKGSGLSEIDVAVKRAADGSVLIEVEATLQISVNGHTREEMEAQGLSEELLGSEAYRQLLSELGLPAQR